MSPTERDQTQDVVRLLRRISALERLLVRYRTGSNMLSESLHLELEKTHQWADEISEAYKNKVAT